MTAAAIREGLAGIEKAIREGVREVADAIANASYSTEAAIGELDSTLISIDSEIATHGRRPDDGLPGLAVVLDEILAELRHRPIKGSR